MDGSSVGPFSARRAARWSHTSAPMLVFAWLLLLAFDALRRMLGFAGLCRAVGRVRAWRPGPHDAALSTRLYCTAVETASVYYFRRVNCLQSGATAVCLLRLHGIPADLVIGVQRLPFEAHAWVESHGRVVMNDRPRLELYRAIARF